MKFNLKSTAIFLVFMSLFVATIASGLRSRKLKQQLFDLQESHGFVTQETYGRTGDRWEIVPIGQLFSPADTFLIRVRNYENYRLHIHFYDGLTQEYKTDTHDFVANETVVRYLPEHNTIFVHDTTWPIENQTIFEISGTPRFYNISNGLASDIIDAKPIQGFVMLTTDPGPIGISKTFYENREKIEATCKKHEMKIAWFTISKRP